MHNTTFTCRANEKLPVKKDKQDFANKIDMYTFLMYKIGNVIVFVSGHISYAFYHSQAVGNCVMCNS